VSKTDSLAPAWTPHPLNLLAAGATTLGEVIPLTSPARSSPLLPAKWLGRLFSFSAIEPQDRIAGLSHGRLAQRLWRPGLWCPTPCADLAAPLLLSSAFALPAHARSGTDQRRGLAAIFTAATEQSGAAASVVR
jgi:hypothetical protein